MWITRDIAARTLVWIAALAVPAQGLPGVSCGCAGGEKCCQQERTSQCCCSAKKSRDGRCCCASRSSQTTHLCCSEAQDHQDSGCTCGMTCQCNKTHQQHSAIPPVENDHQMESVGGDLLTAISLDTVDEHQATPFPNATSADGTLGALDRCVSLCRFTL